jgi:hypothetical protein
VEALEVFGVTAGEADQAVIAAVYEAPVEPAPLPAPATVCVSAMQRVRLAAAPGDPPSRQR